MNDNLQKSSIHLIDMDNLENFTHYELYALRQLKNWQSKMLKPQSLFNRLGKKIQNRLNKIIPDKVHNTVTTIIKKMVQTVLFTSELIKPDLVTGQSLEEREGAVTKRMEYYRATAATEGGITGWGGFFTALADFPLLLAIKLKFLFDVASLYGHDTSEFKERIFLLHVFKLAFSSPAGQKETFLTLEGWAKHPETLPNNKDAIDWYRFQQDYRDYLDLAKLLQMIPVVGAAVGVVVNYSLLSKLSETAMMCYRMRWLHDLNKD